MLTAKVVSRPRVSDRLVLECVGDGGGAACAAEDFRGLDGERTGNGVLAPEAFCHALLVALTFGHVGVGGALTCLADRHENDQNEREPCDNGLYKCKPGPGFR